MPYKFNLLVFYVLDIISELIFSLISFHSLLVFLHIYLAVICIRESVTTYSFSVYICIF